MQMKLLKKINNETFQNVDENSNVQKKYYL